MTPAQTLAGMSPTERVLYAKLLALQAVITDVAGLAYGQFSEAAAEKHKREMLASDLQLGESFGPIDVELLTAFGLQVRDQLGRVLQSVTQSERATREAVLAERTAVPSLAASA